MQSKVHIHLHVSDLEKSRDFYQRFFGEAPVKQKPGYIKFLPTIGPVNLALSKSPSQTTCVGRDTHYGIQLDSTDDVMAALARAKRAELAIDEENAVNCCYANQDKFWVTDPDGVRWEIYAINHDIE